MNSWKFKRKEDHFDILKIFKMTAKIYIYTILKLNKKRKNNLSNINLHIKSTTLSSIKKQKYGRYFFSIIFD